MAKYDRLKAVEYASQWWDKRNPRYYNFDLIGGDCTNFISQCLYHGGLGMKYGQNPWFYSSISSRSPSWTGVEEFYSFLITNKSENSAKAVLVSREDVGVGDIIQLDQKGGRFNHTLLVSHVVEWVGKKDIYITCHSGDAFNKNLNEYKYLRIRYLKIING